MIIKCKMCGGDLIITEGSSVCECEYCGTKQTVPTADNEKKMTLFSRASRLLRNCEFDKASGVFETIVADFPEEAEAYWGLVLCKYGIEYVDDPETGKKVPTCHRSSFDSVLDDANFEQACENADSIARRVYRDEARQIEELRKGIIEVSGKEDPYDIFISYKETDENGERTLDSVIAQEIYNELTEKGYRVFFSRISLESKLGTEYEPYIFAALNSAKVMIVVGTDYENFDSVWVKNEWSRFLKLIASGQKKTLIPVFKNMDAYDMPKEFVKLSAQDMGKIGAMQDLARGVEKLIGKKKAETVKEPEKETIVIQQSGGPNIAALLKRGQQALEDGDWEKAADFYEQILSMDAENIEAFFGLFLAGAECPNEDAYIHRVFAQSVQNETLTVSPDTDRVEISIKNNTVKGYLSEDQICSLYDYDLSYISKVKGCQEIAETEKELLESDRNLSRAIRFANGDPTARPIRFRARLFTEFNNAEERAKELEKSAEEKKKEEYKAFLDTADVKVEEAYQQAQAKKKSDYEWLCNIAENVSSSADCRRVIWDFKNRFSNYRDSEARMKQCEEKEQSFRLKETRARRKVLSVIAAIVLLAVTVFLVTKVVIPEQQRRAAYQAAAELYSEGKYDEAIGAFEALGDYKDSASKITEVQTAKKEAAYQAAARLYSEGEYDEAIGAFQALGDYKDSASKITEVQTAKKEAAYQAAAELYSEGKYDEAIGAFQALGDYKDSASKITEIKKEVAYQAAAILYSAGDYDGAYNKYSRLHGYKDVDTLLSTDKNLLAAREAKRTQCKIVGRTVTFGAYEQDNNTSNGKEDIEWIVLANEGKRSLLISLYALDCQQYNTQRIDVTWETCSLRYWLDGTFLNAAFTTDEQKAILKISVDNSKGQGKKSIFWFGKGGNNTTDQIFLLSYAEAKKYFASDSDRICQPTSYAKAQGANTNDSGNCWWWLRSPGLLQDGAAGVERDGSLGDYSYVDGGRYAVRPAFWINLESDIF